MPGWQPGSFACLFWLEHYFFFLPVFFAAFFVAFLAGDFFAAFFAADFLVAAFFTAKGIPRLMVDFLLLALFLLTAFAAFLPLFAPLLLLFAADFVAAFLAGAFLAGGVGAGAVGAAALLAGGGAAVFLAAAF
jgi:hypothetical protein